MKKADMSGLTVKDGRMINSRPQMQSGISKAAAMRRQSKSKTQIKDIADGIELAKMRAMMRGM